MVSNKNVTTHPPGPVFSKARRPLGSHLVGGRGSGTPIQLFQLFGSQVPEVISQMVSLLKPGLKTSEKVLLRLQCLLKLLPYPQQIPLNTLDLIILLSRLNLQHGEVSIFELQSRLSSS